MIWIQEQLSVAVSSGLSTEDLLFKDENYLPISDLDLRVLVADLKASLERFYLKLPDVQIRRVILTGVNSSHPLLVDLLAEMLGLPIVLFRSSAVTGLAGLSMGDLLLQSALGRLTGLALGLLPNDQHLTCSLDAHGFNHQESQHQSDAVAVLIFELIRSSDWYGSVAVEASSSVLITDAQKPVDADVVRVDANLEAESALDSSSLTTEDSFVVSAEPPEDSLSLPVEHDPVESFPTPLPTGLNVEEEPVEVVVEEMPTEHVSEQEWPSIASLQMSFSRILKLWMLAVHQRGNGLRSLALPLPVLITLFLKWSGHPLLLRSKLKNPSKKLWILKTTPLNGLQLFLMMCWLQMMWFSLQTILC